MISRPEDVVEKNQHQAVLSATVNPSIRQDLDRYLDTIAEATAIFKEAVDSYLRAGPDGVCWRQAKQIDDHLRAVDDLQQKIGTGVHAHWLIGALVLDVTVPLAGVSRLLKEMKRQITGFAIESGFTIPGRRVPLDLLPEMQTLTHTVCATVNALIAKYRPAAGWWTGDQSNEWLRVGWYENQADRYSTAILKKIFADHRLGVENKLPLAQLVEEIDRLADQAQGIDRQIRRGSERHPVGALRR